MTSKEQSFVIPIITVLLTSLILCVFLLPRLIADQPQMLKLNFLTAGQSIDGDTVIYHGTFDSDLPENETLWIYAENAQINLSIQGKTYSFNDRTETPKMFRSPGSGWHAFISPGLDAGEEVEFTIRSYYGENDKAVWNLFSRLHRGDGGGIYRLMLGQINFVAVVMICAFFAGILYMLGGLIHIMQGTRREGMRIGLLGMYCFTGSIWGVTDSFYPYFNLLVTPRWAGNLIDALGLILFPIALAGMIRFYMRDIRSRKVMGLVVTAEVITAAACLLRQLTGQADLLEQQLLIGAVALLLLLIAIICIVIDLRRYRDNYLFLLLLTVLPVFAAVAVDGANILFPFMPRRIVMRYGFGLSVLLLVIQIASYARAEQARAEQLRRLEQELTDSRISVMLSQIQPHFLYNALTSIKTLCSSDPEKAEDAMEHFSYFLRSNLDSLSDNRLISFEKEIDHVKDYFYLEKLRFKDRVNLVLKLDFCDFLLPPLTIQPLVENAVRYGITKKEDGGTIVIRSLFQDGQVQILITDDGEGFDVNTPQNDGRSHTGIENVRSRLQQQCGGTLEISSQMGLGTKARITLPGKEIVS